MDASLQFDEEEEDDELECDDVDIKDDWLEILDVRLSDKDTKFSGTIGGLQAIGFGWTGCVRLTLAFDAALFP